MTYNDHIKHIQEVAGPTVEYVTGLEQRITELEAQLESQNDHLVLLNVEYVTGLEQRITELEAQLDSQNDDLVLLNDENYCHRFRIGQLEAGIRDALNALDDMREDGRDEILVAIPELIHLRKLVTHEHI